MAREFAQIKLAIWADDDWRDLSPDARYLYLTLLTSPTLTHCGTADWRPARLSAVNGQERDVIEDAGAEMVHSLHILIDEETEEVLIRSFIRNDGLMKQPKMAVAMASAHAGVASPILRGVIVHEAKRLRDDFPELSGWGAEKARDLLGLRSVNPSTYPLGKGSIKGSGKGKATPIGKGSIKGSPTPSPTTTPTGSSLSDVTAGAETATRADIDRLCGHLADRIEANGSKRPEIGKTWHDAARLMLDRDKRTEADIHAAIDWCQSDEFWRPNVLSMPKLRDKYDTLRLQAQRSGAPQRPTTNKAEERIAANLSLVEQLRAEDQQRTSHLRAIEGNA